jgi:hypothetical protein
MLLLMLVSFVRGISAAFQKPRIVLPNRQFFLSGQNFEDTSQLATG